MSTHGNFGSRESYGGNNYRYAPNLIQVHHILVFSQVKRAKSLSLVTPWQCVYEGSLQVGSPLRTPRQPVHIHHQVLCLGVFPSVADFCF